MNGNGTFVRKLGYLQCVSLHLEAWLLEAICKKLGVWGFVRSIRSHILFVWKNRTKDVRPKIIRKSVSARNIFQLARGSVSFPAFPKILRLSAIENQRSAPLIC